MQELTRWNAVCLTSVMQTFEDTKSACKRPPSFPTQVDLELRKIESFIESVSNKLLDSQLELGESVRLSVVLGELEAYARGIRFAMGQTPPWEEGF
jgi:hypothetical protein